MRGNRPLDASSSGGANVACRFGCYCVYVLGRPWLVTLSNITDITENQAVEINGYLRAAYVRNCGVARQLLLLSISRPVDPL
jgi:hypothetical protein